MRLVSLFLAAMVFTCSALAADAPPATAPEKAFFSRLIGSWDVQYEIYAKDGKVRRLPGRVSYAWILDGATLQETWSDVDGQQVKPYATTISYEDGKHGRWTAVYIYPQAGMPTIVTGGVVGDSIVLQGQDPSGALQRWWLGDLKPESFTARYEISEDQGKTWRLLGINYMRRPASKVISSDTAPPAG